MCCVSAIEGGCPSIGPCGVEAVATVHRAVAARTERYDRACAAARRIPPVLLAGRAVTAVASLTALPTVPRRTRESVGRRAEDVAVARAPSLGTALRAPARPGLWTAPRGSVARRRCRGTAAADRHTSAPGPRWVGHRVREGCISLRSASGFLIRLTHRWLVFTTGTLMLDDDGLGSEVDVDLPDAVHLEQLVFHPRLQRSQLMPGTWNRCSVIDIDGPPGGTMRWRRCRPRPIPCSAVYRTSGVPRLGGALIHPRTMCSSEVSLIGYRAARPTVVSQRTALPRSSGRWKTAREAAGPAHDARSSPCGKGDRAAGRGAVAKSVVTSIRSANCA